uniref:RNA-directed DNA polymerase, eukaryota n=1 Tax=Tanacetum cinerariifolium TaxID=118510 RepID=A0A6L2NE28_TANCI|nr:RNA-directed DNA polymerase, eukaryota [Tanacetum cinerariifolium]
MAGSMKRMQCLCTVVDVYIPFKKSKAGKRFAFVHFIKVIQDVIQDFVSDERVVWVDIEGIPLHAWSCETFTKIRKKWGEALNIEDSSKGKLFMVRAKELFTWNPIFLPFKEKEYSSDEESVRGENSKEVQSHSSVEVDGKFNASEVDGVAETIFGDNSASFMKHNVEMAEHHSKDPFELYELLNQKKNEEESWNTSPSLSHPPGFTPVGSEAANITQHVIGEKVINLDKESSSVISAKVMNTSQVVQEEVSCNSEGCEKDIVSIIRNQGEETKMERVSHMDVKFMWGNSSYDYTCSESLGSSGGILCIWEDTVFKKDYVTISDSFVAIYRTWIPNKAKILIVAIYAPQQPMYKRVLWEYFSFFDQFISSSGLVDVKMEGFAFTWSHPLTNKMSKLDRFLISDGVISLFPSITVICLDRHLSDHRLILLCEINLDYGPTPFWLYYSWFSFAGFDEMVEQTWRSFSHSDRNGMIHFKKKLQELKKELDQGGVPDSSIHRRHELKCKLNDIKEMEATNSMQKSKVRRAIEEDENSKFFHGIINKKRSHLAIHEVFDEGMWITDPSLVKKAFLDHYGARFKKPTTAGLKLNFPFPNRLSQVQVEDLERGVSQEEIRSTVWDCGENKSPGPDGFTFEFYRKYWEFVGPDLCGAVEHFFENGSFSKGCNSSSIALIPKVTDVKFVNDYRPISLIGSVYKVVTNIMANRLALVIADIISETQSAFVAKRQILDGDGNNTRFWLDTWKGDKSFRDIFPRIFALESNHQILVAAEKLDASLEDSLHRHVRGGLEQQQFSELSSIVESVSLSSSLDRWVCSMSSDGVFSVKEVRIAIDDLYLPSQSESTRWVKVVPIK